ncbi:MAG: type II secretion system protein M [Thiotrichales bacterium]|nr:type II secretion system protein M [Thiotrichales bacterium]
MWMQSKQAWSQLADRERTLLLFLGVFLIVALFYLAIWSPIHSANQQAIQTEERAQQDWQWLSEQVQLNPMVSRANTRLKFGTQSELMSTLQSTLRNENLLPSMDSMTPASKSIKVEFKAVDAPRFFAWLSFLEQQGLVSSQLQVKSVNTGVIEASVRFGVTQ